jgi:hypothetical protein
VLTVAVNIGTVTIGDIYIGTSKLTKGTDYTVAGGAVTLKATYLDDLTEDDYTITIETNQGDVTAVLTVIDTTTLSVAPEEATFDLNPGGANNGNLEFEIKHNTTGVTLASVHNGDTALTLTTHYTTDDLVITILKTYLATLDKGAVTITFKTNKGDVDAVITIEDTTEVG